MKQRFTLLMAMLCVCFSLMAADYDVQVDGIKYNLSEKYAKVTRGVYKGDIVIPSTINIDGVEYMVVEIENRAFKGCNLLSSVDIPNTVGIIGDEAFKGCTKLTSVIIPGSVNTIGDGAFSLCDGLESVTLSGQPTIIKGSAFYYCKNLTSVHITDLEAWCNIIFWGASSNPLYYAHHLYLNGELITQLDIPQTITEIKDNSFCGCTSLTSVIMPDAVTRIGNYAFWQCSNLETVSMGAGTELIDEYAFAECSHFETMTCKAETVPNTSEQAFEMTFVNNATLLVPEKSLEAYQATAPWSGFGTIKAMAEGSSIRNTVMSGVAFHSANGLIHISGLKTGKRVMFYSIDGKLLGAATADDGTTSFAAKPGTLVVARIGRESMKIAVK